MLHIASTFVLLLIGAGLYFRKSQPRWHFRFMSAAFLTDIALVLYIELSRHAVEKVATRFRAMIWFHAAISLGVIACYIAMIVLGRRVHAGQQASRKTHRNLGMTFVVLRLTNYVTAFAV